MATKALFFDIDGTLLNSNGVMNKPVYDTLLQCRAAGLIVGLVTARATRLVFRDHEIPGDKTALLDRGVFYNGGTVIDNKHGFYQHTPVPGHIVKAIVDCVGHYDDTLQIALQHDNLYHSFKFEIPNDDLISWGFLRNEIQPFDMAQVHPATKMMIFSGITWKGISGDLSTLYRQLQGLFQDSANIILADSKKCIYVVSKYATKGTAISKLISLYGIRPEEVAVFGDDTPDMGMFGMFGHSIAMGNADQSLKAMASFVTLSNDEDGVVHAIISHLNLL